MKNDIYLIADQIRSLSNLGLVYSINEFDTERYDKLLSLSAELHSVCDESDFTDVNKIFRGNITHFSPLIGSEAIIYEDNKVLLMKRHDDNLWAFPGGLTEVGETAAEAALRELHEETGISGNVERLLGVFDSRKWKSQLKFHMYHFLFLVNGDTSGMHTTDEALDIDFFSKSKLPPLSPGHDLRVPFIFELLEENKGIYCD